MMLRAFALCVLLPTLTPAAALASECTNPDALGTSRVLYIDPTEHPRIGSVQYRETLPLADHEVVLTFDDGPLPPHTGRILDILLAECVRATFFSVGSMARNRPALLQRAYDEGHSIGSHSQNHPLNLSRLSKAAAWAEMENGRLSVAAALGPTRLAAPFMRFPGFSRTAALEASAKAGGQMIWNADIYAFDWTRISSEEVVRRPIEKLEVVGRGVVLFHDIQPRTVSALPVFLRELKQRGFKVVHVAPAGPTQAKTETMISQWRAIDHSLLATPVKMNRPARARGGKARSTQSVSSPASEDSGLWFFAKPSERVRFEDPFRRN
jgi:peptidoglycan/xylan/chitin deacetylase (PgdA/CDA1 family)